jgi:DNA polymerase I-like protein with 3'-5' exonuclease and polymerase domains
MTEIKTAERTLTTDADVGELAYNIENAGPDARVTYDVETGCTEEMDEAFGGYGALMPYAGAYLTGMSVCITYPSSFSNGNTLFGYYIPLGHERGNVSTHARNRIAAALSQTRATHVGFNTPFDWAFLLNEGLLYDVPVKAHDVQIKRWLQDENGVKKLKVLGEMWLGEDASREQRELHELMAAPCSKITEAIEAVLTAYPELGYYKVRGERIPYDGREGKKLWPNDEARAMAEELRRRRSWAQLTVQELGQYAARDATLTAQLDHLLDHTSPKRTIDREMKVNAICIDMSRRGIGVDIDQLHAAAFSYEAQENEVRKALLEVHGLENPNSGPQVAALLYDRLGLPIRGRTPSGEPSTDKNALEQLAGDPVAAQVLLARKLMKARTAYAEAFAKHAERSADGRVHGLYGTTRTVTGRLAASGPNVMTIPREDSLAGGAPGVPRGPRQRHRAQSASTSSRPSCGSRPASQKTRCSPRCSSKARTCTPR